LSSSSGSDGAGSGGRPPALDAVDPVLLGQLIRRHGAPRQAPPIPFAEQERRQIAQRRERAIAAADQGLIRHIERHERHADDLGRAAMAEPVPARASIAQFDLAAWPIRAKVAGEERELEPSEELRRALNHRTPQAFLRDLHRPVVSFGTVQLRRVPSPGSAAASLARIRAAIDGAMVQQSRDEALQPLATRLMNQGMSELRTILARPWEESRPEQPLPMPGTAPDVEDSNWFGLSGGYDPDV
jgi:hypothetical protein